MFIVKIKENKEQPILAGHPWIFAGAIDRVDSHSEKYLCRVLDSKGRFVCQGFYNPYSQIAVRVLSLGRDNIDRDMFANRIDKAILFRKHIIPEATNCYRLINAEGDRLPGLVADRYGDVIVIQFLCMAMDKFRDDIIDLFAARYPGYAIHERSDAKSRKAEGLDMQSGPISGTLPEGDLEVLEEGRRVLIDVKTGDRTGYYLEYRPIRSFVGSVSKGKSVLDLFSYTGGFALSACLAGASSVTSVDSSMPAQAIVKRNMEINSISSFVWHHQREDVSALLSRETSLYDIVICDPPPFSRPEDYNNIFSLAMSRVESGGMMLALTSYSPRFGVYELMKATAKAACSFGLTARVAGKLSQGPDYPYMASHPEGEHVHGLILNIEKG
jgi:23S rRNA (cytosine1962-C5)-methyltransferase